MSNVAHALGVTRRLRLGTIVAFAVVVAACGGRGSSAPAAGITWSAATTLPSAPGGGLTRVIAAGPGFVAVGNAGPTGPGMLWTSSDGSAWQTAAQVPGLTDKRLLLTAASGPAGVVAMGPSCSGECGGGYPIVSADLASWTAGSAVKPADFSSVKDITWDGAKFVAVGDEITDASPVGYVAHVWTSTDGLTWTTLPQTAALDGATMSSVIKGQAGFIAVGAAQADGQFRAAAWTSTDGTTWTRSPDSPAFDGAFAYGVVAGGPGYVAVGRGPDGAAVWTSTDGRTWTAAAESPALANAEMHAVVASSTGLVAVGYDHDTALIWASPDGMSWTRVTSLANAGGAQALSVAQAKGVYVAVGGAGLNGTAQPFVWVGR